MPGRERANLVVGFVWMTDVVLVWVVQGWMVGWVERVGWWVRVVRGCWEVQRVQEEGHSVLLLPILGFDGAGGAYYRQVPVHSVSSRSSACEILLL